MEPKALAPSLVDSFTEFDPAQITPDLVEVALDHVLDEGIIKDIPIVRAMIGVVKTAASIRDRALVKKLVGFLFSLNSASSETRSNFKARMNVDEEFKKKVGEKLLLIIERLDDMSKPNLVAHAFQAYMEELIDFETFQRLASAIDKSFYSDLMALKSAHSPNKLSPQAKLELSNSGIIELQSTPSINLSSRNNQYQITDLGRDLLKFVLNQ
ncbi:MAG: hypothetical protein JSW66_10245 [Phycisphaerales bacterium]|nr:MAG: hypothetical protein JSW66_10245 [Phycisphaerales bacterium]